jgi:chromosomal replication initiation ATPase DnaA
MADLTIPAEIEKKYPELIKLIVASESMNDEERQYWINIIPAMTPEQIEQLKGILVSERAQLSTIDKKYSKEIEEIGQEQFVKQIQEARKKRQEERTKAEQEARAQEESTEENILKKIQEA